MNINGLIHTTSIYMSGATGCYSAVDIKINFIKSYHSNARYVEHIWYEFFMFIRSFIKTQDYETILNKSFDNYELKHDYNVYLENFLLHYRNILEFTGSAGQGLDHYLNGNPKEVRIITIKDFNFDKSLVQLNIHKDYKNVRDLYGTLCSCIQHLKCKERSESFIDKQWQTHEELKCVLPFIKNFKDFLTQNYDQYIFFDDLEKHLPLTEYLKKL